MAGLFPPYCVKFLAIRTVGLRKFAWSGEKNPLALGHFAIYQTRLSRMQ